MRRLAVITSVVAAALLVPASPATAKGPVTVKICGQDDCVIVKDDFTDAPYAGNGLVNSDSLDFGDAPPPSSYYSLELKADWMEQDTSYFVPASGVLRVGSNWLALGGADAAAPRAAIRD